MEKVLVLGASSFVGRRLVKHLGLERTIATFRSPPISGPIGSGVYFDPLTMRVADILPTQHGCSHAVILFANTDANDCFYNPIQARNLNVEATLRVIQDVCELGMVPVFASSEFLFDGTRGNYTEDDKPSPILEYGRHKWEVERLLEQHFDRFLTVRLAKIYGDEIGDDTLFTNWIGLLRRATTTIECAADQYFSPIFVDDLCHALIELMQLGSTGCFHVAGPERCSRIDLLRLLAGKVKEANGPTVRIIPRSIHDLGLPEKRPLDVSMNPGKLVHHTGIQLTSVQEFCSRVVPTLMCREELPYVAL